jgi:hypothetical protein
MIIVFGLLTLFWVLCLVVSVSAQPTASGRIAAGVVFGLFIVLSVGGLYGVRRSWRQLEVGRDAIVSRPGGKGQSFTLTGGQGYTLRVLPQFKLYAKIRHPRLLLLGLGGFLLLRGFQPGKVRRVCEAQGWRFDGDPALAVKDVQSWLNRGQSVEAVQLLELFGPFPDAPSAGEPQTALAAAVYEDVGDNLIGSSRSNARDAYRRAAAAQRAFAACARSQDESAARLAEASRIDAKTQP